MLDQYRPLTLFLDHLSDLRGEVGRDHEFPQVLLGTGDLNEVRDIPLGARQLRHLGEGGAPSIA